MRLVLPAFAVLALAACASTPTGVDVSYSDLDLPAQRDVLVERLDEAARQSCDAYHWAFMSGSASADERFDACVRDTREGALASLEASGVL